MRKNYYTLLLTSCTLVRLIASGKCGLYLSTVTYKCYSEEQCGSASGGPVTINSYSGNGEGVCCNGSFSSWEVQSNSTCNSCPTSGKL